MRITLLILVTLIFCSCSRKQVEAKAVHQPTIFKKAEPVWAKGRETEMNLTLGFKGTFKMIDPDDPVLKITGSTLYRVSVNGKYLGYGPARASHGYYRVDEYDLSPYLKKGENVIAIEVTGYNVNSLYVLDQPSFLQAEILNGDKVLLATERSKSKVTGRSRSFEAFELDSRVQKVRRYSSQRPFMEYYRLEESSDDWKTVSNSSSNKVGLAVCSVKKLLYRNLELPDFRVTRPQSTIYRGHIRWEKKEEYRKNATGKFIEGFSEDTHTVTPSLTIQDMHTQSLEEVDEDDITESLGTNQFYTLDFGTNLSGFIGSKITCTEPSTVYFTFDELLLDGEVNPKERMPSINNVIVYELEPGTYELESFEAYTFRFLRMTVVKGTCQVQDAYIREYAYPENESAMYQSDDPALNKIYEACKQTFRQNSVDLFMDCPSRERAGWLCDSRFMAIVEKDFTGRDDIAYNYYQNYRLYTPFDNLPKGMIPMVYPADNRNGNFIPNWALWFVIQVSEYAERGGDPRLVEDLRPRIMELLDYFAPFENEDGLLENLKGWKFVEWSKANEFVNGVNYPTNALYSKALMEASKLYDTPELGTKSQKIAQAIREQSFNGEFFVDNAIRDAEGKLKPTSNISEVGQYYAFFFELATPREYPELWKKLVTAFGPDRNDISIYPNVFKANAFIGNYLRMEILYRYGLSDQMLQEMKGYFLSMAELTGTLWEHMDTHASCNHGFASYLGHLLYQGALGIRNIDYIRKEVTVRFDETYLTACQGSIPVGKERIYLKWERSGDKLKYVLELPEEYTVKIENPEGFEVIER
ncbi:Bacterial alpha-L-rhamnosidase [Echinicola soli]|uniref:Bacterial alpha-L-rhamnosidase n=1 Tax=Echinicola soli TaxID=2591634 RepID=A0A514CN97_9BACT|nr:family 78 glycoside hydrolase catalytic domain [Echinicola soli]QDH81296.1 Bacterial alpha-L-rhamnosidase [Echinicola soli]